MRLLLRKLGYVPYSDLENVRRILSAEAKQHYDEKIASRKRMEQMTPDRKVSEWATEMLTNGIMTGRVFGLEIALDVLKEIK